MLVVQDKELAPYRLVFYSSGDPRKKANAALLIALYVVRRSVRAHTLPTVRRHPRPLLSVDGRTSPDTLGSLPTHCGARIPLLPRCRKGSIRF